MFIYRWMEQLVTQLQPLDTDVTAWMYKDGCDLVVSISVIKQ